MKTAEMLPHPAPDNDGRTLRRFDKLLDRLSRYSTVRMDQLASYMESPRSDVLLSAKINWGFFDLSLREQGKILLVTADLGDEVFSRASLVEPIGKWGKLFIPDEWASILYITLNNQAPEPDPYEMETELILTAGTIAEAYDLAYTRGQKSEGTFFRQDIDPQSWLMSRGTSVKYIRPIRDILEGRMPKGPVL